MEADLARDLILMFVDRIMDDVFPGETGASRVQQLGLFMIVFALEAREEPVTAARIAEITRQSDSRVQRQVQKLIARDLIERTRIKNKLGRGQAWQLSIKHSPRAKKLLDAIRQAAEQKR
jgi:DNA-binding MarR family transcriptional regulator